MSRDPSRTVFAVGMMAGTSLDGIDAALVSIENGRLVSCESYLSFPLSPDLAQQLRAVASSEPTTASELSALASRIGLEHGKVFDQLLFRSKRRVSEVEFIAAHGITICHEPSPSGGHGWQIVGGGALAARIGVPVICDFRAADLALGGQGAPLAPLADLPLRGSDQEDRVILNLGGIANLSALPRGADSMHQVRSCDVGPANMPLDELCRRDATLELSYDDGGSLAESSSPNESLLEDLLNEDWVRSRLPRSFGREQFGSDWVDAVEARAPSLGLAERLATLVDFEARVTRIVVEELLGDWRVDAGQPLRLLVTGGGRHNRAVMAALRRHFPDAKVEPIEAIGENGDAKECVDFAWLGWMRWNSQVAELKCMSGAVADTVLGCIYDGRRAQG